MEVGGTCPSLALTLIAEGKEQIVAIDKKALLCKVMSVLGAREMPVLEMVDCGDNGAKVRIRIDVSCAKYCIGQQSNAVVLEGDPSRSEVKAQNSAVLKVINYLSDKHLIKVLDYSSRVTRDVESNNAFGHVNAAIYKVMKILAMWEANIGDCAQLAIELEGKPDDVQIYVSLRDFASMLIERFKEKMSTAKSKAAQVESAKNQYINIATERNKTNMRKGFLQEAVITPKYVLDYVTKYLGGGTPEYMNGPSSYGMMKGVVKFYIPCIDGIDICGNLTIKGKCIRSISAEEDAAYNALQYLEKKYRLKIVDLNYNQRIQAEAEKKSMVRILEQIIDVANAVKKYWAKMVKSINNELKAHKIDPATIFTGSDATMNIEAYKFCAIKVEKLAHAVNQSYAECAGTFEELQELECKLEEMKNELEIN